MTGVCWLHLRDNLNLIDRADAASWGTHRADRARMEIKGGSERRWGEGMRYWRALGGQEGCVDMAAWRWCARDRWSTSSQSRSAVTSSACHVRRPWQQSIWGPHGTKRVLKPNQTGWKEKGETLGPSRLPLVWAIHLWLTRSGILNKPCTSWTAEKPHSGTWRRPCICKSLRVLFEIKEDSMFALIKVKWERNSSYRNVERNSVFVGHNLIQPTRINFLPTTAHSLCPVPVI